jgi:hypothetical protein
MACELQRAAAARRGGLISDVTAEGLRLQAAESGGMKTKAYSARTKHA